MVTSSQCGYDNGGITMSRSNNFKRIADLIKVLLSPYKPEMEILIMGDAMKIAVIVKLDFIGLPGQCHTLPAVITSDDIDNYPESVAANFVGKIQGTITAIALEQVNLESMVH